MVPMIVRGGGVVQICSRRGCRGHMLDVGGVPLCADYMLELDARQIAPLRDDPDPATRSPGDIADENRDCADVLCHVHISENDRSTPGQGNVAWKTTFATLREIGYDGWMVVEAFGLALPEIAAAISEPLSRAGTTTIISQGGDSGSGTGASKLTEDAVQVLSQLSPIMEQLAGTSLFAGLFRDRRCARPPGQHLPDLLRQ